MQEHPSTCITAQIWIKQRKHNRRLRFCQAISWFLTSFVSFTFEVKRKKRIFGGISKDLGLSHVQLDYFTGRQSLPVYSLSDRGFWRVRDLSTKSCHCSRDFCSAVASCAQLKVKLRHFVKSSRWVHCTLKAPPLVKYWTVLVFPIHSNIYTTVRSPRVAINRKWCIFAFASFLTCMDRRQPRLMSCGWFFCWAQTYFLITFFFLRNLLHYRMALNEAGGYETTCERGNSCCVA